MEATIAPERRYYTEDEWIALEEELDTKFDYLDGYLYDVRAMAGGTMPHGRACSNVSRHLGNGAAARGTGCFTYNSEIKVHVEKHNRYYYPDASVRCGEEEPGGKAGSYKNPRVIVEVVSASSVYRDTVSKFKHYTALKSLRDYVLVYLNEPIVHVFSRQSHKQIMSVTAYDGLDASVYLPSLDLHVAMADLYAEVDFPEPTDDHDDEERD